MLADNMVVHDFRNPTYLYTENGILKSHKPDMLHRNECFHCHKKNVILLNNEDFALWHESKKYVQDVFTWLQPHQRELITSGIHSECWNEMFSEEQ